MITICLHGAESTGKSVLAARLGLPWVPEYGRTYCEERGTDLTMADLLTIAEGQAEENRKAMASAPPVLLLDTDQLMTAAWAAMPPMMRSVRSLNMCGSGWPKNRQPITSPLRSATGTAR